MAYEIFFVYYSILAGLTLFSIFANVSDRANKYWFAILSVPLVVFTAFRPIGMMRDDVFYCNILAWQPEDYLSKMHSLRDPLFYTIALILSGFSVDAGMLLYFIGFVLMLKLIIIYRLGGDNRLLLLFMYLSIYWQLHDLTQLRVSLSVLFFLGFFYFAKTGNRFLSSVSIIASAFSHAQALFNVVFLYKTPKLSKHFVFLSAIVIILLLAFDYRIDIDSVYKIFIFFAGDSEFQLREALRAYVIIAKSDWAPSNSHLPIIFLIACVTYLYSIFYINFEVYARPHVRAAVLSIVMGAIISWFFSSVSDMQVRFYEYYFVGGLVLAAEVGRRSSLIALYIFSIIYFVKFNVKWSIWDLSVVNSKIHVLSNIVN